MSVIADLDLLALWAAIWPAVTIALLRMGDVALNVFRVVFVIQERQLLAATAAALEAAMWLTAAGIVFAEMTPVRAAGFVIGVGAGTAIGVRITRALRLGMVTVRIYVDASRTDEHGIPLQLGEATAHALHAEGLRATVFRGQGFGGPVDMVLSTIRRREADRVVAIARGIEPTAFAAIDNALHPAAGPTTVSAGRV